MASAVVLLRGINLGSTNRIAMPALRDALGAAGFENARTYVQSGNIVLDTELDPTELSERVERVITERFGLDVSALARGERELASVVTNNPFPELVAEEPKRFQVTFVRGEFEPGIEEALEQRATPTERVAVRGREIYAWHPDGVGRSKLALKLGAKAGLGKSVVATSRNWTTVLTLLEMVSNDAG